MATLSSNMSIAYRSELSDVIELAQVTAIVNESLLTTLLTGTGDDQNNAVYEDINTLADGGSATIDLTSVSGAFGDTFAFISVKAVIINNKSETQTLVIGGAASDAWVGPFGDIDQTLSIPPMGTFVIIAPKAGYSVSSGSKNLKILNGSAGDPTEYTIWMVGCK